MARPAAAQLDPGVVADRFVPAPGPSSLLAVEGGDFPAPGLSAGALSLGYVARPITIVNRVTGAVVSRPVSSLATADAAVEVGLTRHLAIGLGVPLIIAARGDRLAGLGSGEERPLAPLVFGDVRLRIKVRLFDRRAVHLALAGIFTAPGGGERDFAATAGPTFEPRAAGDFASRWITVAAHVGYRFAPQRTFLATRFGGELDWGAGAVIGPWPLRAVVEVQGAVGVDVHPIELRGALRVVLPRGFSIDAGGGAGLVRDPTTPSWRAFAVARYAG
ncbi:MAG: hypothetical protein EXR72_17925 [Myxococcales bacterium]|nr:hypothetical protein [Myxococcales bacterium]